MWSRLLALGWEHIHELSGGSKLIVWILKSEMFPGCKGRETVTEEVWKLYAKDSLLVWKCQKTAKSQGTQLDVTKKQILPTPPAAIYVFPLPTQSWLPWAYRNAGISNILLKKKPSCNPNSPVVNYPIPLLLFAASTLKEFVYTCSVQFHISYSGLNPF